MTSDPVLATVLIAVVAVVASNLVAWAAINFARTVNVAPATPAVPSGPPAAGPPVAVEPPAPEQPAGPAPPAPPVTPPVVVQPQPPPPPVVVAPAPTAPPAASDFDACMSLVLKYEGGNDDDPRDPGGRTSRGILQREWDVWRQTHAGLPQDVWQAPQDQILAIYRQNYWNALYCDSLPPGIDLATFDYGVNSGISRAAKTLQGLVGADADGEVGPDTIAAAAKSDAVSVVGRMCDSRLSFLQGLGTWGTFGRGWTSRVQDVRTHALAMASAAPQPRAPTLPPAANIPAPAAGAPWLTLARSLVGTHAQNDNKTIMAWPAAIAAKYPDMASYCARYIHDSIAWCGLFVAYCLAASGVRPVFGETDTDKFLWADAWKSFGAPVDPNGAGPQPGDILVFRWAGGGEHVTFYDHEEDDDYYHCTGGNQGNSHVVSTEAMPMANCIAIRRPSI